MTNFRKTLTETREILPVIHEDIDGGKENFSSLVPTDKYRRKKSLHFISFLIFRARGFE